MPRVQTEMPRLGSWMLDPCKSEPSGAVASSWLKWGFVTGCGAPTVTLPPGPLDSSLQRTPGSGRYFGPAPPLPGLARSLQTQMDEPCPSWCLQSVNTCVHFCCPGRVGGGEGDSPILPTLIKSVDLAGFASVQSLSSGLWLQLMTLLGPLPSTGLAECLCSPLALSPPMPPTLGILLIPFPPGGLIPPGG